MSLTGTGLPIDGCYLLQQRNSAVRTGPSELMLPARAYAAGDTVSVTVKNVSAAPVMYVRWLCQRTLERQHGPAWTVAIGPGTGCVLVAAYLAPGRSTPLLYRLPADLCS